MEVNHFPISIAARYAQLGSLENPKENWYVLHGYKQLAPHFINKFKSIQTEYRSIIAPEGLNRFYLEGYSGRVGASWMTKEDRSVDIVNYCAMLDQLNEHLNYSPEVKQVLLGFSQGAATAVRWFCLGKSKFDALVLWAGSFPKDMDIGLLKSSLQSVPLVLVVGKQDEFIKSEHINNVKNLLDGAEISYALIEFEGNHNIDELALDRVLEQI